MLFCNTSHLKSHCNFLSLQLKINLAEAKLIFTNFSNVYWRRKTLQQLPDQIIQ
ncbi:hypothetical protein LEQ41_01225 [Streptococcus agalactiae]|nr:hypothetical protein [Streptococcus agalactiae]